MEKPRINAIAAIGKNRELGKNGQLIWKFTADFERMKRLIRGHSLIMGRSTYESIGRELPNTNSVVITGQPDYHSPYQKAENTFIVHSLEEAIVKASELEQSNVEKEVFIFGGSSVYREALPQTERLYLTEIDATDSDADTFFPEYQEFQRVIESEEHNDENITFRLLTLERSS